MSNFIVNMKLLHCGLKIYIRLVELLTDTLLSIFLPHDVTSVTYTCTIVDILFLLFISNIGIVTGQQRMLTSFRRLILPLHLLEVRVDLHSILYLPFGL
jgi:hypothetical protein